jgi:outer membrane protein assembly factor BamB
MAFSPDSNSLIAGDASEAVRLDLSGHRKSNLPIAIQRYTSGTLAVLDDTRALVISRGKPGDRAVRSLKDGDVLAIPNFKADSACLATDARYALLFDAGMPGARVFDLQDSRTVETPRNIGIDVYGGELALATNNGDVLLYRLGERQPGASFLLPLEGIPVLRSVSATPSLDELAVALDGEGALFQIESGQRISSFQQFSAVNFVEPTTAFLLMPGRQTGPSQPLEYVIDHVDTHGAVFAASKDREATLAFGQQAVVRLDAATGKTSPLWTGGKDHLRSGGPVLFEYSFENSAGRAMLLPQIEESGVSFLQRGLALPQGVSVPFRLRALDPATGKELWNRSFSGFPPIPFADPQGERLVLGWKANSKGAEAAAKRNSTVRQSFKRAKINKQDSFFEVLDAPSGKSLGGVLVQVGNGPASYDTAFSVGDALFLVKDGKRVSLYSLQDGSLKARFVGGLPAVNAKSKLFAIEETTGNLFIYDLATATKLDQQIFPDAIAYTHFSADGNRLFVLTQHQVAYVLDASNLRTSLKSASPTTPQ